MEPAHLDAVYRVLYHAYGPQHWWPGDSPFEVMVGAVLTQNTAWSNVERALARLNERIPLAAEAILALDHETLADAIRPAGYFNVKARRLRAFCHAFVEEGGLAGLSSLDTKALRERLLAINGVGPETADDMLLYAFERPVFVVDAYTRRLFARLGLLDGDEGYETIRDAFERALGPDTECFNEYHALIVRHAKEVCRTRPRCAGCCLGELCPSAS
ncbi:putative endonuclease III-like protein [Thioflavicoccus mobilis 8321]|uniref:Putative endonuclease III-like protein n=1 Tax=Thioflavicoccus mobilis 8321 TaxID=765912 RepID=L0GXP9_9GAMM|nr:endonuclease III domain-containing protein [Thioflavicoccus mobilis]AGA90602.1 putative endonuclease III-like protein [Thioflavicoccus mobilis 8321]